MLSENKFWKKFSIFWKIFFSNLFSENIFLNIKFIFRKRLVFKKYFTRRKFMFQKDDWRKFFLFFFLKFTLSFLLLFPLRNFHVISFNEILITLIDILTFFSF